MIRTDILDRKNEILQWISEHKSKAYIAKELQCKQETLNTYLAKMNIVYEGNQGSKGTVRTNGNYVKVLDYIKKENVKSPVLKQKLIKEGFKENKCEICGNLYWQGQELPLELHHVNGNHYDNNLNNLQILCSNCHSLMHKSIPKMLPKTNKCVDCGTLISNKAQRCKSCAVKAKHQLEAKITKEELKALIRTQPFTHIGKQFNVSDNAIRKWCKHFDLPSTKKEINKYSDEKWNLL